MVEKTGELPAMTGKGVEKLIIPAIDKAVVKYEQKKDARCKVSPAEVAAKDELLVALHKNRDKLPKNEEGNFFYRYEGVDYVLEESLKRKKVSSGDDGVD
jgi:hypothetical protein